MKCLSGNLGGMVECAMVWLLLCMTVVYRAIHELFLAVFLGLELNSESVY